MKLKRNNKALIKDLELQIDYLIGYSPSGLHWKQEWSMRQKMLDEAMAGDYLPQEIRDKIDQIQDSLYRLREQDKTQPYYSELNESPDDLHDVVIHDWKHEEEVKPFRGIKITMDNNYNQICYLENREVATEEQLNEWVEAINHKSGQYWVYLKNAPQVMYIGNNTLYRGQNYKGLLNQEELDKTEAVSNYVTIHRLGQMARMETMGKIAKSRKWFVYNK